MDDRTKDQPGSSCFDQTEVSKRPVRLIDLGRRIVRELKIEDGVDTTRKWMSHHLATLIDAAETEKDPDRKCKLEEQCSCLICRLWTVEGFAYKLERLSETLSRATAARDSLWDFRQLAYESPESPWVRFVRAAFLAEKQTWAMALQTALLEEGLGADRPWLEALKDRAEDDDVRQVLEALLSWFDDDILDTPAIPLESLTPAERNLQILDQLQRAIDRQQSALDTLRSELKAQASGAK